MDDLFEWNDWRQQDERNRKQAVKCLCSERKPCPIHRDQPLKMPDVENHHCYVINVYRKWSTQEWFATIARDAVRIYQTTGCDSKFEAIGFAGEYLTESVKA